MRLTQHLVKAAREINADIYDCQAQDTLFQFIEEAGWTWTEPQVATDPTGVAHYISAEAGFVEQVYQVYQLHKQLRQYGYL